MSLTLTAIPNPQQQLESLQRELYQRNRQIAELEETLRQERAKNASIERGVGELRTVLSPLYQALGHVFGEIEHMGVGEVASGSTMSPRAQAAWANWKQKLGGLPAKFIDALMVHGSMTQTQLRIAVGCANGSVAGVVSTLWKAGLINKNSGKISLKEL
jgi:hypothetical protein